MKTEQGQQTPSSTGSHQSHIIHHSRPTTPHTQPKPIKISGNESTKSSSSSTSAESSADSNERLILTKPNAVDKASGTASGSDDNGEVFHYEAIVDPNVTKPKYAYHDEPHSFENSMEYLEDYKNFQYEVLETTV